MGVAPHFCSSPSGAGLGLGGCLLMLTSRSWRSWMWSSSFSCSFSACRQGYDHHHNQSFAFQMAVQHWLCFRDRTSSARKQGNPAKQLSSLQNRADRVPLHLPTPSPQPLLWAASPPASPLPPPPSPAPHLLGVLALQDHEPVLQLEEGLQLALDLLGVQHQLALALALARLEAVQRPVACRYAQGQKGSGGTLGGGSQWRQPRIYRCGSSSKCERLHGVQLAAAARAEACARAW